MIRYSFGLNRVPTTYGGSPSPRSTSTSTSSAPGSVTRNWRIAFAPSSAGSVRASRTTVGATFATVTFASADEDAVPSETVSFAFPTKSSGYVCCTVGSVVVTSTVPSFVKSHAYVRASLSGSEDPLALNVIGEPSIPVYGPPVAAVGASLQTRATSRVCAMSRPSSAPAPSTNRNARIGSGPAHVAASVKAHSVPVEKGPTTPPSVL